PDQTVTGPSGTAVSHAFPHEGAFSIGLITIAPGGASAPASRPIDVRMVATQPDPLDPSKTALAVGAAPDGDVIEVFPGDPGTLVVYVGGQWLTEPAPTGHVLAYGQDGNDVLLAFNVSCWLYGGAGNDVMEAGLGDGLLFGGPGDDVLFALYGSYVLVGGD